MKVNHFHALLLAATATFAASAQDYTLPFSFAPSSVNIGQCLIIDSNGDDVGTDMGVWTLDVDAFLYKYNSDNAADDWVILPPVDFGTATTVVVSFQTQTGGYPEGFEMFLGQQQTKAAMTVPVIKKENYKNNNGYETMKATVDLPATDGENTWCLGIHAISEADQYTLYIKDINIIDDNAPKTIPAEPTLVSSSVSGSTYSATVKAPLLDTNGDELTGDLTLTVFVDGTESSTRTVEPGSNNDFELTLRPGQYTIGYQCVLGEYASTILEDVVKVGAIEGDTGALPFNFPATQENYDQCINIDANGDAQEGGYYNNGEWSYAGSYGFKYTYSSTETADDWLILPLVDFGDCTKVEVSIDVETSYDEENFEVYLGQERTVDGMTLKVIEETNFVHEYYPTTLTASVDIPEEAVENNNKWAVGIHASSEPYKYNIYVTNVTVLALEVSGVESVAAEAGEVEYYNLQGVRVANPAAGQLLIRRQGNKVSKIKY